MRQVLKAARPLSDVVWDIEAGAVAPDTPERRADLQARLMKRADTIADATVQEYYRAMFRDRLWAAFRSKRGGQGMRGAPAANRGSGASLRRNLGGMNRRAQQAVLAAMINHPALRDEFAEALGALSFDPDLDKVLQRLQNLFAERIDLDFAAIRTHFCQGGDERLLDGVLERQVYVLAPFAAPDATVEGAREGLGHLIGRRVQERLKNEVAALGRTAAESASIEDEARVFAAGRDAIESDRLLADIDE